MDEGRKYMKVNILGTEYTLEESDIMVDARLDGQDGYCDTSTKRCVVDRFAEKSVMNKEDVNAYKRIVMRHELLHAVLYECGLDSQSWGANEELVDWIAVQFPKLAKIFLEAGCAN